MPRRWARHRTGPQLAFRNKGGFAYYEDSAWYNMLFVGGYGFDTRRRP